MPNEKNSGETGPGEMAQQLSVSALAQDVSSVPGPQVGQLTTTCNSSLRGAVGLFWSHRHLCTHALLFTHTCTTYTHTCVPHTQTDMHHTHMYMHAQSGRYTHKHHTHTHHTCMHRCMHRHAGTYTYTCTHTSTQMSTVRSTWMVI